LARFPNEQRLHVSLLPLVASSSFSLLQSVS